jgi:Putative peptidoglycan binding domain
MRRLISTERLTIAPDRSRRRIRGGEPDGLLRLQQAAGNAAVSGLLSLQRQVDPSEGQLTLPDLVGDPELEKAFRNDPVLRRDKRPVPERTGVNKVQRALQRLGYKMPKSTTRGGEPDGKFGQETESVIWRFQTDQHLHFKDGRVGHETLSKLQELLTPGGPKPIATGKQAGVDPFTVKWFRDPFEGMDEAVRGHDGRIRLEYAATFKDDATHDPAMAEFRQSIKLRVVINGKVTRDLDVADDGYGHRDGTIQRDETYTASGYTGRDRPGVIPLDDTDDVLIEFTVTNTIIDLALGGAVIAQRGPHTATIKGRHPRTFEGVPFES